MNTENPSEEEVKYPEDDIDFDEQDDVIFLPVIIPQDDKHFNRMGFYCAIGESENPKGKFDALLLRHKESIDEKLKQIEYHYYLDILRFETKIEELKKKLEEEKFKLFTHKFDIDELLKARDALKVEVNNLETEINQLYKDLGEQKSKLIENRVEDVKSELAKLVGGYDSITDQKSQINAKSYDNSKDALKIKVDLFQKFADSYSNIYSGIKKKIEILNVAGIGDYISSFLIYAGFTAAIAAGWFFSIYALKNNLNSESTLFFLLSGLFNFGQEFITASNSKVLASLYMTLSLIIFLALTGVIAWFCQWLLDKYEKVNTKNKLVFEISEDEKFVFNTQISAKTFLSFWLQVLPFVFILGIVFIILILGNAAENVNKLDISLSGQVAGTAIAFLCTGIAFLYITKVIEPRIEMQASNNAPISWLRSNIELFLLITLFLISIFGLLFGVEKLTGIAVGNRFISLLEFTICVLLTSFMLGYGLRYKGLISTTEYLERRLKELTDAIKDNSRARPLNLILAEGKQFNKKYLELQEELLNLIIAKTKVAKEFLPSEDIKGNQNTTKKKENWWSRLFNNAKIVETEDKNGKMAFEMSPIEEVYFPGFKNHIDELKSLITSKNVELEKTENQLSAIKADKSEYATILVKSIKKIETKISNLRKAITNRYFKWTQTIDVQKKQGDKENMEIWDGYNLGMWYRENGIGPTPDYYQLSKNQLKIDANGNEQ